MKTQMPRSRQSKNNLARTSRKSVQRTGAAAVEFALTFPALLLLVFGSYELCRANMMMQTTEAAAYEGTRVAIVPGSTAAEAENAARQILGTAGIRNANVVVSPSNLGTETETVSVEIAVDFQDNFFLASIFMSNEPFVRKCELVREDVQ